MREIREREGRKRQSKGGRKRGYREIKREREGERGGGIDGGREKRSPR